MISWSRLKQMIPQILHLGDSPRRTALAFAIGVFIAFSPTYGLHTASVFFLSWAFRLNVLAMLAGSLTNNPWTLLPILASSMWVGLWLMPVGIPPAVDWSNFTLQMLWEQLRPFVLPFALGGTVLGLTLAIISYPIMYVAILRIRERQARGKPLAPPTLSC